MTFRKIIRKLMMLSPGYRKAFFVEQKLEKKSAELLAAIEAARPADRTGELLAAIESIRADNRELAEKLSFVQEGQALNSAMNRFLNQYDSKFKEEFAPQDHYVSYTYPTCFWWGWGCNLGDWIQTIATESAIRRALGRDVAFERVRRDELVSHRGGICVMQGWFEHSSLNFLPGPDTHAIWIGTHFRKETRKDLELLWHIFPSSIPFEIGCRDLSTLEFCQANHIEAYFSRCLSLTLPRRKPEFSHGDSVYCVDCPDWLMESMPIHLRRKAVTISQRMFRCEDQRVCRTAAEELLERYRTSASLVITTALHCASPCLAMGIPTVVVNPGYEESERFSSLSGLAHVYTKDEVLSGVVNWNPGSIDFESLKLLLIHNLKLMLTSCGNADEKREVRSQIAGYTVFGSGECNR